MIATRRSGDVHRPRSGEVKGSGNRAGGRLGRSIVGLACALVVAVGIGLISRAQQAVPEVTLKYSDEYPTGDVLIGETFTFIVEFDIVPNTGAVGELPFVELYLEYRGADCNDEIPGTTNDGPCDGIRFVSAAMELSNPNPYPLQPVYPGSLRILEGACVSGGECTSGLAISTNQHPYAPDVTALNHEGHQLVVLPLPFTSYPADAIPIEIVVTAQVHAYADHGAQLQVCARGGFRGANPVQFSTVESLPFTPGAFTVSKSHPAIDCQCQCTHCADETVTGPNHPGTYTINVNVAAGQTIENLAIHDILPNEVQFGESNQYLPALTVFGPPEAASVYPDPNHPDGVLELYWDSVSDVLGSAPDLLVEYEFFVPEFDASGQPIVWEGCSPQVAENVIEGQAEWTPMDPRDAPVTVGFTADHRLALKCLALQKTVNLQIDTNHPLVTPGDTLEYTLTFQVSDYTTFGEIVVEDHLSDGQTYLSEASLHVEGPEIGVWDIPFDPYLEVDPGPFEYGCPVVGGTCGGSSTATIAGGTRMVFHVSEAMEDVIGTGELAGLPDVAQPAVGSITYRVSVDDVFEDHAWLKAQGLFAPLSDSEVDKLDPLLDCARIFAEQHRPTVSHVEDGTYTCAQLVGDILVKSVYSVHRPQPAPGQDFGPYGQVYWSWPHDVFPGDRVTYRIRKVIPSCDAEHLEIRDWLAAAVFDVGGYTWSYDVSGPSTASPAPGEWKLGPDHTAPTPSGGYLNVLSVNAAENALTFDYGSIVDQGANQPCVIDILFTVVVSGAPLPDETTVVNVAQECESITYASGCSGGGCSGTGATYCQMAIAEFTLREPELHVTKGVIAAIPYEDPLVPGYGQFNPLVPGPVTFRLPCETGPGIPAFDPIITSLGLAAHPIDSDLSGVDAGDLVRFALVIENRGGAPAFDVEICDAIPWSCFEEPACGFNLTVTDGVGDGFTCATAPCTPSQLFDPSAGIELLDPGPTADPAGAIDGESSDPGRNVVVITYDLRLRDDVTIGDCCTNAGELLYYASVEGGANFVGEGLVDPWEEEDEADVCIEPVARKCVVATSESHTVPQSGTAVDAAIGEIVKYRLLISLPEQQYPSLEIEDHLDPGLEYIQDTACYMFLYDDSLTAGIGVNDPAVLPSGGCSEAPLVPELVIDPDPQQAAPLLFQFGAVTNFDNDPNAEYLVVEFMARVKNTAGNSGSTSLDNYCEVLVNGQPVEQSNTVIVTIVEPQLVLTKSATFEQGSAGCPIPDAAPTFEFTVTNVGQATAFDVFLKDFPTPVGWWLPPGLWDHDCTGPAGVGDLTGWPSWYGWPLPDMSPGESITCWLRMVHDGSCCDVANSGEVTWTSLPGDHGTIPNPTGLHAGVPGSASGERTGDGSAPNDYVDVDAIALCGRIEGTKFLDNVIINGQQDTGPGGTSEPGQEGWTITATDADGCTWTATTGYDGSYSFCLPPGTYAVEEEMEPGWVTWNGQPIIHTVVVVAGQTVPDIDFANVQCSCSLSSASVSWPSQTPVTVACGAGTVVPVTLQSSTDVIQIGASPTCVPVQCQATYDWEVSDTAGNTVDASSAAQFSFDPPGSGTYDVLLTFDCSGSECTCSFQLAVSEGGCGCGQFDTVTIDWGTGPQLLQDGTSGYLDDDITIVLEADYECSPASCSVQSYVFQFAEGSSSVQYTSTSDPAQISHQIPQGAGTIDVTVTAQCGGQACGAFSFTIHYLGVDKCGAWTDFDGDGKGEIRVEGRVVDCGGEIRLKRDEIDGPVTIQPTYGCGAGAGPCFYRWSVTGPGGYVGGSGDEAVRGPLEFESRAGGLYRARIEPVCTGQTCEVCDVSIAIEAGEEPVCECSRWGGIDINGETVTCGGRVTLPADEVLIFDTGYTCSGTECDTQFIWQIDGPEGFHLLEGSEEIRFRPPFVGLYEVTLTPTCDGLECPGCWFTMVVERDTACESRAFFTLNGRPDSFIIVGASEDLILDGSGSTCVTDYFLTVQLSDENWGEQGPPAEGYLTPEEGASIDHLDVRAYAANRGLELMPGNYYRILLGVTEPWHDVTKLVFIER